MDTSPKWTAKLGPKGVHVLASGLIPVQFSSQVFEDIHLDKRKWLKDTLGIMNYIFAVTFTIEMLLKILGMGFVGYFSNLWNCLDCFIVAVSLANCKETNVIEKAKFLSKRTAQTMRRITFPYTRTE